MYKKIYLEITNVCNIDCSFCHKTKRKKHFLSEEEFTLLAAKIKKHTDYLYFHLMGEPLLHPHAGKFLDIAAALGFKVTIVTNGVLIKEKENELLGRSLYKITFSLHSYEANRLEISLSEYLYNIINFCKKAEKDGTICVLRLWNDGGDNMLNQKITDILKQHFTFTENSRGYSLSEKVYLESAQKFIWPDKEAPTQNVHFCMGLRDHIGVLCDGSVVPCCLDADGEITLGNLLKEELSDIISTSRAKNIYNGFSEKRCAEELCRRCGYAARFG